VEVQARQRLAPEQAEQLPIGDAFCNSCFFQGQEAAHPLDESEPRLLDARPDFRLGRSWMDRLTFEHRLGDVTVQRRTQVAWPERRVTLVYFSLRERLESRLERQLPLIDEPRRGNAPGIPGHEADHDLVDEDGCGNG